MKNHGGEHDDVIDLTEARTRSSERAGGLTRNSGAQQQPPWRDQATDTIVDRPLTTTEGSESAAEPDELRSALFDHSERVIQSRRLELTPARNDRSLGKPDGTLRQRLFKRR